MGLSFLAIKILLFRVLAPSQIKNLIAMEALEKAQIITHVEKSVTYTVFGVKWLPSSAKVVVLGSHPKDTGALQVYELSKGELKLVLEVGFN